MPWCVQVPTPTPTPAPTPTLTPPPYSPPSFPPPIFNPPSYTPPSFTPPIFNPPSYTPPSFTPPSSSSAPCSSTQTLTAASGSFSDGPGNYGDNANCEWFISGSGITLSFSGFGTESGYDFVRVYDGSTQLGSFSGSSVPAPLTSSGSMRVVFTSDGSVQDTGFTASYSTGGGGVVATPPAAVSTPILPVYSPPSYPAPAATPDSSSSVPCSGTQTLTAASGSFSDGPGTYGDNANCEWFISGSGITLSFSGFGTESGYDFVRVYDGSTQLGSFSGSNVPAPLTSSGSMRVVFTSDGSVQDTGFTASYSTGGGGGATPPVYGAPSYTSPVSVTPPTAAASSNAVLSGGQCSGALTVPVSSVPTSIGLSSYTNSANCIWNLEASLRVSLTFISLNTENGYDFVYVFDGPSTASSLLGFFSGSATPAPVQSTGEPIFSLYLAYI